MLQPAVENDKYNRGIFFIVLVALVCLAFQVRFINSISVGLMVVSVLLHPMRKLYIARAFGDFIFLSFLTFILIQVAGLLYTSDVHRNWNEVTKKVNIIGISFFFCAIRNFRASYMKTWMIAWSLSLAAVSIFCLVYATTVYVKDHDDSVFFYHQLVHPFRHHAIFFSFFILFSVLYWLEDGIWQLPVKWKRMVVLLLLFFLGMIVMLSSKIVIGIAVLYLIFFAVRHGVRHNQKWILPITISGCLLVLLLVLFTHNPVKERFKDITAGNSRLFEQEKFSPDIYFNGLQFRLLTWRFTYEILQEKNAWVMGVSPGDAQHELDKKYVQTGMYMGDGKKDTGFFGFNCHNVYLQTLLESGVAGLVFLLAAIVFVMKEARRRRKKIAVIFFAAMLVFGFTESVLSTQYAILLFIFFPLLAITADKPEALSRTAS